MEAVGRLAGGIAHDFNNVLQALLSHVQLLHSRPQQLEQELSEVEAQVRRGAALARQLLLFSRQEPARRRRLDLNETIGKGANLIRRLVRENIEVVVRQCEHPVMVEADDGQVEQILMNLVVNAADAMPACGRLHIRTGQTPEHAWFEVEDTGCGIPEAVRERVFDPFFTTKAAGHGTGLGLSVVHGIVEQHGGRVELDSAEGAGTRLRVLLPSKDSGEQEPVSPPPAAGPLPRGNGERILLVEDEEAARDGLREILTDFGYHATAAGTGAEAAQLARDAEFDVLLTDIMLPDIDGTLLARDLLNNRPELKVMLMSGYSHDDAAHQATNLGVVEFLQKPFDMRTLARALRRVLVGSEEPAVDAPGE